MPNEVRWHRAVKECGINNLPGSRLHFDLLRLDFLALSDFDFEDTIFGARLDLIHVCRVRQHKPAIEGAAEALYAAVAFLLFFLLFAALTFDREHAI